MNVPSEWSKEVADTYNPVRILGKGAFASVVLAKDKTTNEKVAVKVIGSPPSAGSDEREKSLKYARREVEILRKLDHPNIVKVSNYWDFLEQKDDGNIPINSNTICIMALSYARGPTVESLLQHGGALSNKFGRVVVAQVVSALAYMHYHGVVHRDIKPDNVIVTGALSKDDEIWDNIDTEAESNWGELRKKWNCTLVDFGFARALMPDDCSKQLRSENRRASFMDIGNSADTRISSSGRISSSSRRSSTGRMSISHKIHHRLSALGNRQFAAPEIINKVQHDTTAKDSVDETTGTLSEYVAEYGLLVDSYSLGHTIRYMMTGCRPNENVEDAIRAQNSLCSKLCGGNKNKKGRSIRYRKHSELPSAVWDLIKKLTEVAEKNRLSIRNARRSVPWISDVFEGEELSEEQQHRLSEISYLYK